MGTFIILALFSGIAVAACVFVAGYFFFVNNERLIHRTLGFLFIAIALRIGKSIFYYLFPEISLFGVSFGFLGLSTIGPLLWLYTGLSTESRAGLKKSDNFHTILPILGFLGIISGSVDPYLVYLSGTTVLFFYLAACWYMAIPGDVQHKGWNLWLLTSVSLVWGALAYQLISDTILNYAYGAAVAALVTYVLIFRMLKNPSIFQKKIAYNIQPELIDRVVKCLEEERLYQHSALNLTQLANHLDEPVYRVSKAVKKHYGRNFPEVVNSLRIEEVKRRLEIEKDTFCKVEGMAYEVGFNTPSAFYAAFKKETSSSPREYQRSLQEA